MRNHWRRKFTIIELLVVITIISILISLLLPALEDAKRQARLAVCASNLKQVHVTMLTYADDNDGYAYGIQMWQSYFLARQSDPHVRNLGTLILDGYLDVDSEEPDILFCPSSKITTGWLTPSKDMNNKTSQHRFKLKHDSYSGYSVNELIARQYHGKRKGVWGMYRGFRWYSWPHDFGLASDSLYRSTSNHELNHIDKYQYVNADGAVHRYHDPQLNLYHRGNNYQHGVKSRLDPGETVRTVEGILEIMNDVLELPSP